jgi:dihydrofolate reductase
MDFKLFVVTHHVPTEWPHPDAPFTLITDGLRSANRPGSGLRRGPGCIGKPGNIAGQAFTAGSVDEVRIDLVPVVFGAGVRFFGHYAGSPLLLDDPQVVQGDRVTHLHYSVRKS